MSLWFNPYYSSSPQNRQINLPAHSPQVCCLSFQDDAVGLVIKDNIANITAVEAGPGGADTAGQEGVHGWGLIGARDVHGRRGQWPLLDNLVDVSHGLKDTLLVSAENTQHPWGSKGRNDPGVRSPAKDQLTGHDGTWPSRNPWAVYHILCLQHLS